MVLELGYQKPLFSRWVARVGVGAGPIVASPTFRIAGRAVDSPTAVAFTTQAMAGLGFILGEGVVEASLRGGYGWAPPGQRDVGQLDQLGLALGYRVNF
jgi:hypothetical protein